MIFLYEYKFKYATYKYVSMVSKFYSQKCLLSVFLTNDKALTNIAEYVKRVPTEYLHSSLTNFLKVREMLSAIFLLQNTSD